MILTDREIAALGCKQLLSERVCLPLHGRLAARVEGKSSLARCGIGVHVTAPVIHAGFEVLAA